MIITITIIFAGLVGALGKTHKPYTNKTIEWMKSDNDASVIDVFEI